MAELKPDKKNFWHYKECPEDPKVTELMPGFEIQYFITEDTVPDNDNMVFIHSIFPKGGVHHKHKHMNSNEIAYLVKGRCIDGVTIDGKDVEQVIGPGTAVWASRGQVHWHRNPFDEPFEFIGVYSGAPSIEKSGYVDLRTEEQKKQKK